MKFLKNFILAILFLGGSATAAAQDTPAFPGAEGHGRYTEGGRGGQVVHVTNLNDDGPGSFRQAVKNHKPKTVVFDVGGVIALEKDLRIGDNTTIAGQTAPAPGITLRYYTVRPGSNNIIRFIRVRRGQERDVNDGADAFWTNHVTGLIIDHCSLSWSIDEVASFYDNNNFTMQWSTIGESLNHAGHGKGAHGYGGIWGGKLASFHHNLIIHVNNRAPRFCGARYGWEGYKQNKLYDKYGWQNYVQAENVDMRNCVVYNCGEGKCYGGPGGGQINMVNNYFKAGPSTKNASLLTQVSVGSPDNSKGHPNAYGMTSRYYIQGNTVEAAGIKMENRDWQGVKVDKKGVYNYNNGFFCSADSQKLYGDDVDHIVKRGVRYVNIKMQNPVPAGTVTTHTAAEAFNKVLTFAGASLHRDEVDARYAEEAKNGTATYKGSVGNTPGQLDIVADCKGYTEQTFPTSKRPEGFDTDGDGMPDAWEKANGLNPNDPSDGTAYTIDKQQWYTNLEVYLNSLVEDIMKRENADATNNFEEYYPASK